MSNQPTILVKKADGSMVRMTLDEVRKIKAAASIWQKSRPALSQDTVSLLEEAAPAPHPALSVVSEGRDGQIEKIIKALSFKAPPERQNRFRTILQLYLKDVRSAEQTRDVLQRKPAEGGVGLSDSQARDTLQACQEIVRKTTAYETAAVPAVRGAALPALAAPYNAFQHDPMVHPIPFAGAVKTMTAAPAAPLIVERSSVTPATFKISNQPAKQAMHDIIPPHFQFSPIDEIAYVTLTDFRRLSPDPTEAAVRLKQKFTNLRNESVLLYLEAEEVWRQSPLYKTYVSLIIDHLARGHKLGGGVVDKENIQVPEIIALVTMEQSLHVL